MNYIPIRRARPNQPNGDGIDWGNPATKGLVFLSNASVPGVDMSCPRTKMTTVGNVVSTASGKILTGDTVSSTDSRYYDVHNRKSFTVFGEAYLTDGGSVRIAYLNSYGWAMGQATGMQIKHHLASGALGRAVVLPEVLFHGRPTNRSHLL